MWDCAALDTCSVGNGSMPVLDPHTCKRSGLLVLGCIALVGPPCSYGMMVSCQNLCLLKTVVEPSGPGSHGQQICGHSFCLWSLHYTCLYVIDGLLLYCAHTAVAWGETMWAGGWYHQLGAFRSLGDCMQIQCEMPCQTLSPVSTILLSVIAAFEQT